MATDHSEPYLKYALFCRDTDEGPQGDLVLKGIIDLVDLSLPTEPISQEKPFLTEVDVQLAFCIGGASAGSHFLLVAIKAPGSPLDPPPPQRIDWEEGILFQRWIKLFRIPVQQAGEHTAAILFDGQPLGEASFLVRFKPGTPTEESA